MINRQPRVQTADGQERRKNRGEVHSSLSPSSLHLSHLFNCLFFFLRATKRRKQIQSLDPGKPRSTCDRTTGQDSDDRFKNTDVNTQSRRVTHWKPVLSRVTAAGGAGGDKKLSQIRFCSSTECWQNQLTKNGSITAQNSSRRRKLFTFSQTPVCSVTVDVQTTVTDHCDTEGA